MFLKRTWECKELAQGQSSSIIESYYNKDLDNLRCQSQLAASRAVMTIKFSEIPLLIIKKIFVVLVEICLFLALEISKKYRSDNEKQAHNI